jgi:ribosomal protein S18 acetylase RimI-like enzyme
MTMTSSGVPGTTPGAARPGSVPTAVPGLLLRPASWPEEAATLIDVNNAMRASTGSISVLTVDGIRAYYDNLEHCDLAADLRIGEVDGRPVAYVRVDWRDENRGDRAFGIAPFRSPEAPAGTFGALIDWALARIAEVAPGIAPSGRRAVLGTATFGDDLEGAEALRARGFAEVRFGYEMIRPTLDDIPDIPLPAGVELRPFEAGHLRTIFEAEVAAFAGHWGAGVDDGSDARWREFVEDPFNRRTDLWQIAWSGGAVVGCVRPFVNDVENAALGVRRGWCENISTHAAWRGRGVASALICRALRALRDAGMSEAALGVDAMNETGALRLYEKMGFRAVSREVEWRRPLDDEPGAGR